MHYTLQQPIKKFKQTHIQINKCLLKFIATGYLSDAETVLRNTSDQKFEFDSISDGLQSLWAVDSGRAIYHAALNRIFQPFILQNP